MSRYIYLENIYRQVNVKTKQERRTLIASLSHPACCTVTSSSDCITRRSIVTMALQLTVRAIVVARARYTITFTKQF